MTDYCSGFLYNALAIVIYYRLIQQVVLKDDSTALTAPRRLAVIGTFSSYRTTVGQPLRIQRLCIH
eukprot:2935-Heterococcus_DN1.PRE.6